MHLNRIRALSFDLDDTLWPFLPCIVRAESTLLDWLRTNAPGTRELLSAPTALRDFRAKAVQDHPELHTDLSGLRRASIRAILTAAGEDVSLSEPAFDVFFEQRLSVELYAEALEALTWLSARYPLVGLSNGNGCIHRAGVGRFFVGSLSATDLGVAKPDAAAFDAAARLAGVRTDELLHIGDDWHLDVLGAVGADAQAVWVVRDEAAAARGGDPAGVAHTRVADLMALCRAIEG